MERMNASEFRTLTAGKKSRSKYNAKKTQLDGLTFDSKQEANRYAALKLEERLKQISGLQLQVAFPLQVNGIKVCNYIADFVYVRDGKTIVEDAKGFLTPEYKIKKKLMRAIHGIEILESSAV